MFYDVFLDLCKEFNVTPAKVRKDLDISQSTMASWKSRNLTPNAQTLVLLAEYFHTTPAYLMGNKLAKIPYDTKKILSAVDILANDKYPEIDIPPDLTLDEVQQLLEEMTRIATDANENISIAMNRLLQSMGRLNDMGKQKVLKQAIDYAQDLARIHEYQAPQPSVEPQESTDTTTPQDGSEGPQEDK